MRNSHTRWTNRAPLALAVALAGSANTAPADELLLFQPGQSAWEWLLVPARHDGGKRMREGKDCLFCHQGEELVIGRRVASGENLEPAPIAGLPSVISMNVEAAYDANNLYLSACWAAPEAAPRWGDAEQDTRLTFMLGSAALNVAPVAGCWAACHSDMKGMPDAAPGADLGKYLPGSRVKMSATGGGTGLRGAAELDAQLDEGRYLEYWQVVLERGQANGAGDGYLLGDLVASQAPVVSAEGLSEGPDCSLKMTRPLAPAGRGRHALAEGQEYTLAVALHANHAAGRYHYTAFPVRFRLGGAAEAGVLVASKQ